MIFHNHRLYNQVSYMNTLYRPPTALVNDQAERDALTVNHASWVVYPDGSLEIYNAYTHTWHTLDSSGGVVVPPGAVYVPDYQPSVYPANSLVAYGGQHYVTYLATASVPPAAPWKLANVHLTYEDSTPPTIVLNGPANLTLDQWTYYEEEGARASHPTYDVKDCVKITTAFIDDTHVDVTYTVTTPENVSASVVRHVTLTTAHSTALPQIGLNGQDPQTLATDTPYVESGASALDSTGASLNVIITHNVNTAVAGRYQATYTAVDANGVKRVVKRDVIVSDTVVVLPVGDWPMMWYNPHTLGVSCNGGSNYVNYYMRFKASYKGDAANITGIAIENLGVIQAEAAPGVSGVHLVTDEARLMDPGGFVTCGVTVPKWFVFSAPLDVRPYTLTFYCSDNTQHTITLTPEARPWVVW